MKVITHEHLALYAPDGIQVIVTRRVGSRYLGAMGAAGFVIEDGEVFEISRRQPSFPDENYYQATWRHVLEEPPRGLACRCDPGTTKMILDFVAGAELQSIR